MAPDDLRQVLLYPRRVALIGASGTAGRVGARPQSYLSAHGFAGEVFPINPGRDMVQGVPAWPDIASVPGGAVDHAYILLDADAALDALEECGRAGVRLATMLADGFAERGAEGAARQRRLLEISRTHDIAVLGPNSMGVADLASGFVCTTNGAFAAPNPPQGRFAVLSQSGSIIGALLSRAAAVGLGFRAYASLGNEACLGVGEVGSALVDDPDIDGFVLFLETLRRPDEIARFAAAAREVGKPVIAYLIGRSQAGQELASSHTGAMIGGARALEAFLEAHGIHRIDSFEALGEIANALPLRERLRHRPRSVTVVTTTGGGGGMVLDRISLGGVPVAGVSDASHASLAAKGIRLSRGALVDVTLAGTRYETMKAVVSTLADDPETGLLIAAIGSSAQFSPELAVKPIVDTVAEAGPDAAPIIAVPIPHAPDSIAMFNAGGVPAFRTPESAAEGVAALLRPMRAGTGVTDRVTDRVPASLPAAAAAVLDELPDGPLNEAEGARLFQALGVPGNAPLVLGPQEALPPELPFAGPYVLKLLARAVAHKSDAGGVMLNLPDRRALAQALDTMRGHLAATAPDMPIEGYLVQQMASGLGEAILGLTRDPVVGPMISVGMGGVLTEIYADIALRPAPVSPDVAREMLTEVKGFELFRGFRGRPQGDLEALVAAVVAVSTLALSPRVEEAEINPVLVMPEGDGILALDALVHLGRPGD